MGTQRQSRLNLQDLCVSSRWGLAVDPLAFMPLASRLTSLRLEAFMGQLTGAGKAIGAHLPNLKELVLVVSAASDRVPVCLLTESICSTGVMASAMPAAALQTNSDQLRPLQTQAHGQQCVRCVLLITTKAERTWITPYSPMRRHACLRRTHSSISQRVHSWRGSL